MAFVTSLWHVDLPFALCAFVIGERQFLNMGDVAAQRGRNRRAIPPMLQRNIAHVPLKKCATLL